jgi:hypothetical protein
MISSLTLNSLVMGNTTDYVIQEARGFAGPSVEVSKYPKGGRSGVQVNESFYRERLLRLQIGIRADTALNYASLRRNLQQAFDLVSQGNSTLYITTVDGKNLQTTVNLNAAIEGDFERGQITVGPMRFELIAGDPMFYGQALNMQTIYPPVAGGISIPTAIPFSLSLSGGSITFAHNGNGPYKPVIRVYGPCTNCHVINSTLGLDFYIFNEIPDGAYVEVDMEDQTALYNGTTEDWLEFAGGDWLYLRPGNNTLNFSSDGNEAGSYVEIYYRDAYIGL